MAMAIETKPKRSPALVETRLDAAGLSITLPKSSSVALTRCRDVCAAIANVAPVLSAKSRGIAKALDALIKDLSNGPILLPALEDEESEA